jgi:hypothetical protein
MGFDRAIFTFTLPLWTTAALADAGDYRSYFLSVAGRLPLAASARQLSAMAHCLPMVLYDA